MKLYGGIDPGKTGGLCIVNKNGELEAFDKMPLIEHKTKKSEVDVLAIKNFFRNCCFICLEKSSPMPSKRFDTKTKKIIEVSGGSSSMFYYGCGYGEIRGWLKSCYVEYYEVMPAVWKRFFELKKDKKLATDLAVEKSGYDFILPRCRKPHEGICEAFLIAEYGRLKKNKSSKPSKVQWE